MAGANLRAIQDLTEFIHKHWCLCWNESFNKGVNWYLC